MRPRAQPEDYVYTEAETLSYAALDARVKALEDGGAGGAIDAPKVFQPNWWELALRT